MPTTPVLPNFRFIDLFAGIGGMRLGFERLKKNDGLSGQCVWSCERDKFSRTTYRANFLQDEAESTHPFASDIHEVDIASIPDHDILLAGFPCQPFSLAGVSKKNALGRPHGFDCDEQGNLFFKIADILERKQPPVFLLENVKNLQSHNGGHTFTTIRTILEGLNYELHYKIINAKPWTPQNRERIFIVGFHRTAGVDTHTFSFDNLRIPSKGRWPTLKKVLHHCREGEPWKPRYTDEKTRKVLRKYTLTPNLWKYLVGYAKKHKDRGNGFGFGLVGSGETARTLSARYHKDGSEILIRTRGPGCPRRLTPRECARLMGFPETFSIPVSDTQAYRQFGNAVVVPVVTSIAKLLEPILLRIISDRTN